jgi:HIRAN domain
MAEYFVQVHGIFHRNPDSSDRQKIIRECRPGEDVHLMPEPDNPIDPNAIAVLRENGEQLGYV